MFDHSGSPRALLLWPNSLLSQPSRALWSIPLPLPAEPTCIQWLKAETPVLNDTRRARLWCSIANYYRIVEWRVGKFFQLGRAVFKGLEFGFKFIVGLTQGVKIRDLFIKTVFKKSDRQSEMWNACVQSALKWCKITVQAISQLYFRGLKAQKVEVIVHSQRPSK